MCDISKKTKFKTVTVYKVVRHDKQGNFYACFTLQPINIGVVHNIPTIDGLGEIYIKCGVNGLTYSNYFDTTFELYNPKMIGKVSGFKKSSVARELYTDLNDLTDNVGKLALLKMVLGGDILQGTTDRCRKLDSDEITYAGTEILSIEEVS